MHYYQVLLKYLPQQLTYQSEENIPVGSLIQVALGKRKVNGVITKKLSKPEFECVSIEKVIQTEAVTALQLELCQWMSSYYFASLSKCLQLFLPSSIWKAQIKPHKEQIYQLNGELEELLQQTKRAPKQQEILKSFQNNREQTEQDLKKKFSTSMLSALVKKGFLKKTAGELLNPDNKHQAKPHHDQPLTKEQQLALDTILQSEKTSSSHQNEETRKRGNKIDSSFPRFLVPSFLLHGITGSGKTEIYLQIVKENIEKDLQTVILVPEIALTTELIQHFCAHFPDQISIIHSNLSERERIQNWYRIHQEKTKLILGSRSALFTPWKKLGAIIIDEEHEWTYKQESSPRYHARKVAEQIMELQRDHFVGTRLIASLQNNPCLLLGSATPSVESYFQAGQQKYHLLSLTHRANFSDLPPVKIVDLRDEYHKKNFSMFSEDLQEAIQKRLENQEQCILFLNKRGSSSSVTCRDCGYTPECENCDISLTYHQRLRDFHEGGLICHYCGSFQNNPKTCPNCHSAAIKYFGTGTQKAEEQLQELFPSARILRADKDTTGGKYDFEQIYHHMKDGKADILIGTQMIAKGLDLANITLTGVLLADIGLHFPDFRSSERVFQLLTQVAGRSGRHKPGEVIIQTYQPEHPAIQAAKNHDYKSFYEQEIATRKDHGYPPFSETIKLIFAHPNASVAEKEAFQLHDELQKKLAQHQPQSKNGTWNLPDGYEHVEWELGISPNYIPRLHGKFIWNIHIRGKEPRTLLKEISLPMGWKIDVDPL